MTVELNTPLSPRSKLRGLTAFALLWICAAATPALGSEDVGRSPAPVALPEAFRAYDLDRDGVLSPSESAALRAALSGARQEVQSRTPLTRAQSPRVAPQRQLPAERAARGADQRGLSGERQQPEPGTQAERELQERRRAAVEAVLAQRRGSAAEHLGSREEREAERTAKLSELQAYRYIARYKSPGVKKSTLTFKSGNRPGAKRGKKRGSAYYNKLIQQASRGRGGRYGGKKKFKKKGNNNNNN
jgi:hypothetical protein